MSRLFLEDGESVPVTAVSVCGNFIADIKTKEKIFPSDIFKIGTRL